MLQDPRTLRASTDVPKKHAKSTHYINVGATTHNPPLASHTIYIDDPSSPCATPSRRTTSLPAGHAAFALSPESTPPSLARRLSTPLAALRSTLSGNRTAQGSNGDALAMAGAQQLVNHVDSLMAELVTEEHAKCQADAAASAVQQLQEKEYGHLDTVMQRMSEVDIELAAATDQLDALLQSKLEMLEALGEVEEQQAALVHRLRLMEEETASKLDMIAGLKVALYMVLDEHPDALNNDPDVAACFAAAH